MNKKGQSLVEVVTALAIVAVVFSTTVTLIISVFNLTVSARNTTEAVAISQKIMTEVIESSRENCSRIKIEETRGPINNNNTEYNVTIESIGVAVQVANNEEIEVVDFEEAPFILYTVTVDWKQRNRDYEYKISQFIKK